MVGDAVGDFLTLSESTVLTVEGSALTDPIAFGNRLRDEILGTGLTPLGDAAFVGGSLVPLGGHNVLEAAVLGISTSSFRISVLVEERHLPELTRRFHAALVEGD